MAFLLSVSFFDAHGIRGNITARFMDFQTKLADDLKKAMKGRDQVALRTIRALRAALMEKSIEKRTGERGQGEADAPLPGSTILAVIQKQAKQRRDAISQFREAGRDDLVQKEQEELSVLERYLPEQLSDDAIREELAPILETTGAKGMSDMGNVMKLAMSRFAGRANGADVQRIVRESLSGMG